MTMTLPIALAPRPVLRALVGAAVTGSLLFGPAPSRPSAAAASPPLADAGIALAAPSHSTIGMTPIATGLSKPVLITSAHDGSGRLFIVEQRGTIRVFNNGSVLSGALLNIRSKVSKGGERGLLGLAFHPNFETNRKLYVNYTNTSGDTVIREYRTSASDPNRVAAGSGRTILKINQPFSNHNGGHLAFGPGGYLYIGMGDGGGAGDPGNRAQDKSKLLGKLLRIDVNGTSGKKEYRIPGTNPYVGRKGRDEIWLRGVRNPWRFSFDRATDRLWIGDVGQSRYEEIDRLQSGKGANLGWRVMEGYKCYRPASGCDKSGKVKPLLAYSHVAGRCSVTGGYVYRGSNIPALVGWYVFGDFCSGEIWAVSANASTHADRIRLRDTSRNISSFGEGASGELFVVDHGGTVLRIDHG
jgi:glucose/arabinose dehydrogenase